MFNQANERPVGLPIPFGHTNSVSGKGLDFVRQIDISPGRVTADKGGVAFVLYVRAKAEPQPKGFRRGETP